VSVAGGSAGRIPALVMVFPTTAQSFGTPTAHPLLVSVRRVTGPPGLITDVRFERSPIPRAATPTLDTPVGYDLVYKANSDGKAGIMATRFLTFGLKKEEEEQEVRRSVRTEA